MGASALIGSMVHHVGPEGADLQRRHPSQVGPLWSDKHFFAKRHLQTAMPQQLLMSEPPGRRPHWIK